MEPAVADGCILVAFARQASGWVGSGLADTAGEPSTVVRARVEAARQRQRERFSDADLTCIVDMRTDEVSKFCNLDHSSRKLMKTAMSQLSLKIHRWKIPVRSLEFRIFVAKKDDNYL